MKVVKYIIFTFIFAFLIVFSNCKKEKEQENPSPENTPITIISPNDNTFVFDSVQIVYSVDPVLNIIRTECYVDFELLESFDNVPQDLYFYSENQDPGDTIQYYLKIYAKEGLEYISNIVTLVISQFNQPILDIDILSNEEVELLWTDESNSEDGFILYRSTNNNSFDIIVELEPNLTHYVDSDIDTLNNYKYKVEVFSEHETRASNIAEIGFIYKFRNFQQYEVPESPSSNIALSDDLKKLVVTNYYDEYFTLIDIENGTSKPLFHPEGTKGLAMSKTGGTFATGGTQSYLIRIWDTETGDLIKVFSGGAFGIELCFNNTGEHIVVGGAPTKIWNISTAEEVIRFQTESIVRAIHYANNESVLITAGNDNLIKVWDLTSGDLIRTLEGHTGHIGSIVLTADESQIISGSYEDNTIRIWDASSGTLMNTFNRNSGIASLKINNEDELICATHDGEVFIMSLDGQIIQTFEGHGDLHDMDYNDTYKVIATYGHDSSYNAKLFKTIGQWEIIHP